jgi:Domain of unknown function (DUF5666)
MTFTQLRTCTTLVLAGLLSASCGPDSPDVGIDGLNVGNSGTGTLVYRDVVSIGRVRGLGQLDVNGVHYDVSGATFRLDGNAAVQSDLVVGDVVLLEGQFDPDKGTGTARRVESVHVLQGTIGSVDAANSEIVALGQKIQWSADTAYGDSLVGSASSLHVGDPIRVAGFRNFAGNIIATRIERQTSPAVRYSTLGAITSVAGDGRYLSINDLVVDCSAVPGATGGLVRGLFVSVEGSLNADGTLVASRIESRANQLDSSVSHVAHLEGYFTGLDAANAENFEVEGVRVSISPTTIIKGKLDATEFLEIKGSVGASGAVIASHVNISPDPYCWGCGPDRMVTGRVFDALSGPVGPGSIFMWVALADGSGYSYTGMNGPLLVDAYGRFTARVPQGSRLLVAANRPGYVQPCSQMIDADTNPSFEIEIVAESTLDSANPPLPASAVGKSTFTGSVYEQTASGPQPISGVALSFWIDTGDLFFASTISDRNGHYFACDLPRGPGFGDGIEVWARRSGYLDAIVDMVRTDTDTVLDIEMKRP